MKRLGLALKAGLAGLLFGLSACGSQGPAGQEITVNVLLGSQPASVPVAYQVGDEDWQLATMRKTGVYTFRLPPEETRYGVAVACPSFADYTVGAVLLYQLTTEDTEALTVRCESLEAFTPVRDIAVRVEKAQSDPGSYDRVALVSQFSAHHGNRIGEEVWLTFAAKPEQELLIAAYDHNRPGEPPQRIRFDRHVDASTPPSGAVVYTLDATDETTTGTVNLQNCGSYALFRVGFLSRQGLFAPTLGGKMAPSGAFALVPGAIPGDLYKVTALTHDDFGHRQDATQLFAHNEGAVRVAFGDWFDPSVDEGARPRFTGLRYDARETIGYLIDFYVYGGGRTRGYDFEAFLSRSWLGQGDAYRIPDLASLSGFGGTTPLSGDRLHWRASAVAANRTAGAFLAAEGVAPWEGLHALSLPREPGLWLRTSRGEGIFTVP